MRRQLNLGGVPERRVRRRHTMRQAHRVERHRHLIGRRVQTFASPPECERPWNIDSHAFELCPHDQPDPHQAADHQEAEPTHPGSIPGRRVAHVTSRVRSGLRTSNIHVAWPSSPLHMRRVHFTAHVERQGCLVNTRLLALCFALLAGLPARALAQSTYGAVVGVANDSTGAALPGASVTLTDVQTAFARTGTTDHTGAFEFQNLTQGLYRLEVELTGFQKFTTEPFRVEARQTVRVDARLGVGGVAEQVTVRSGAPLINTETPTVGGKVDNRELQQLPFTFRTQNTSPIPAIQAIPEVQRVGQQFSLSGALPYQTEVSVDGILTTSVRRNGIGAEGVNVFPSIESIEEIKVSSISNTAEYSQLGDITTISKPGTNQFHGTAFYNFNDTGLNANPNYFNKSVAPNQSDNSNYGFSAGGPVVRGRTFFFGTFERLDISRTQSAAATVPSAAFRHGDFSSVATPILDPSTGPAVHRQPDSRVTNQPGRGQTAGDVTFRRRTTARRSTATRSTAPRSRTSSTSGSIRTSAGPHAVRQVQPEEGGHAGADDATRASGRGPTRSRITRW